MDLGGINSSTASGHVSSPSVGVSGSRPSGSGGTRGVEIHFYF